MIQARKAGATLQAIGDMLGLTKERVRQIVDRG
jgi:DNA-directed RNA polymerase sigma subunit (sigma70/sigma32)